MREPPIPVASLDAVAAAVDVGAPIGRVLASGQYILGPEVARFEEAFAAYCGVAHCVGVANGTDALELALRAVGVGVGSRVLVVANAGFYGSAAVRAVGAVPAYVEVDPVTLTMAPEAASRAIETRPAAVIVTHLYGRLAQVEPIVEACAERAIPLIEDCAQAHGARRAGRRAGAFGSVGCFSFYPTKNLGAIGDAGALVTDDSALAARLRSLRQYGWETKYHVALPGGRNSRMDELQAAVLCARLPRLDAWNDERRAVAATYRELLADTPLALPPAGGEDDVAHLFVVRTPRREALRSHLAALGIGTEVHYPVADHLQASEGTSRSDADLPVTVEACSTVMTLPCYPGLDTERLERVAGAIHAFPW